MVNYFDRSCFLLHLIAKGQKWRIKKSNVLEVENLVNETEKEFRGYNTENLPSNEERTHQGYTAYYGEMIQDDHHFGITLLNY